MSNVIKAKRGPAQSGLDAYHRTLYPRLCSALLLCAHVSHLNPHISATRLINA